MKTIGYWITTALLAFFIGSGGIAYVLGADFTMQGFTVLGLPGYVMRLIGVWKVAGAIMLLLPRLPRVKEWAYAGIFIDVTGAAVAHIAAGDLGAYGFRVWVNLIFVVLVGLSWALRPQSRMLGKVSEF
jgi:DoxX-like family